MPWESGQVRLAYSPDGTLLAINLGWIVEVFRLPSATGSTEGLTRKRYGVSTAIP